MLDKVREPDENAGTQQAVVGFVKNGGAGEALYRVEVVEGFDYVEEVALGSVGGCGGNGGRGGYGLEVLGGDVG